MDDTLEPEEPDSDQERPPSDEEQQPKRRRQAPPVPKDGYPGDLWRAGLRQGQKGFNIEVRKVLEAILPGGAHAWRSPTQGDVTLLKQQMVATSLLHPGSPVSRMLLDHNTGSGKTLIMLRVLDNYYHDAKAKIVIVPKDTVMWNFYSSLWEWPSCWRDYACQQIPSAVKLLCGSQGWRSQRCRRWPLATPTLCAEAGRQGLTLQQAIKALLLQPLRDCLEMKRAFYNGKVRRNFVQKCLCRTEQPSTFEAWFWLLLGPHKFIHQDMWG